MKYDMPITLRVNLARVYYAICLCRGQHVNLKTYIRIFELLTKDQLLLYSHGLRLPWEDLCRELELHFAPIDAGLTIFEKKDHKQLIKLASRANYFFAKIAYQNLRENGFILCRQQLCFGDVIFVTFPYSFTPNGVEDENDIRHYIQSFSTCGKN